MNIFVLDESPKKAALYHNDKHVIKMALEYAQILSTVQQLESFPCDISEHLYRPTHIRHPAIQWTRASIENYHWLYELFRYTCEQYTLRYMKIHASYRKLYKLLKKPPEGIIATNPTEHVLIMPEHYYNKNVIKAYRDYYIGDKIHFSTWLSPAQIPFWILEKKHGAKSND